MKKRFSMQIRTRVGVTLGLLSCIVLAMGIFAMYAISHANQVIHNPLLVDYGPSVPPRHAA